MTTNLVLSLAAGCLVGCGVFLLTARGVVRALLGFLLIGNGINVLFIIASGRPGRAPIVGAGAGSEAEMADPLPQALVLTAIVITLAVTAFVMALGYRNAVVTASDAIVDDTEDMRVIARAEHPGESPDDDEVDVLEDPVPDLGEQR